MNKIMGLTLEKKKKKNGVYINPDNFRLLAKTKSLSLSLSIPSRSSPIMLCVKNITNTVNTHLRTLED